MQINLFCIILLAKKIHGFIYDFLLMVLINKIMEKIYFLSIKY